MIRLQFHNILQPHEINLSRHKRKQTVEDNTVHPQPRFFSIPPLFKAVYGSVTLSVNLLHVTFRLMGRAANLIPREGVFW
jgi:hypothetical protein